jgi:hypothetical protein
MLEEDRPSRRLNSVPPPPDPLEIAGSYDWRGVVLWISIEVLAGFLLWLYH